MVSTGTLDQLKQAMAGDHAAFEDLLRPLVRPACQLAYTILGDWQQAEDAVQEAAIKAWRHVGRLRADSVSLRPWFFAIAANEARSLRRRRWFSVVRLADPPTQSHGEPAADLDLQRALSRLPENQRLVLALYYYLDLPLEQVATALGISGAAAKSRLHRALRALRPLLERDQ